jgi:hypothetical protein
MTPERAAAESGAEKKPGADGGPFQLKKSPARTPG